MNSKKREQTAEVCTLIQKESERSSLININVMLLGQMYYINGLSRNVKKARELCNLSQTMMKLAQMYTENRAYIEAEDD